MATYALAAAHPYPCPIRRTPAGWAHAFGGKLWMVFPENITNYNKSARSWAGPSRIPINLRSILWCLIKRILDGTAGQWTLEATGNSIIPAISAWGSCVIWMCCPVMWVYGLLHKLACPIWLDRRSWAKICLTTFQSAGIIWPNFPTAKSLVWVFIK